MKSGLLIQIQDSESFWWYDLDSAKIRKAESCESGNGQSWDQVELEEIKKEDNDSFIHSIVRNMFLTNTIQI